MSSILNGSISESIFGGSRVYKKFEYGSIPSKTVTGTEYQTISGLSFEPSMILLRWNGAATSDSAWFTQANTSFSILIEGTVTNGVNLSGIETINSDGFEIKYDGDGTGGTTTAGEYSAFE